MLIGPYVNGATVVIGGLVGSLLGSRMPERLRTALPLTFGLASMGLGFILVVKVTHMPAVVLAMILGAAFGELIYLERGIGKLAQSARRLVDRVLPPVQGVSQEIFMERFVVLLVLFCISGTGIFGSMHEGMTGDPSILYIKAILDLFTSAIFASTLGYAVAAIAIPQLAIQLSLATMATFIMPLTTPDMLADFSAAGGLIMLATGLRICGVKMFPVANMLPALLMVMPFSGWWTTYIH